MSFSNEMIIGKAQEVFDYMVDIRRQIHMYPEAGMEEFKTASLICSELDKMGIPFRDKVGGTGVVGLIEGNRGPGKVLAIRADIDGLSVEEKNDVPYASKVPGMMHACGHDAHAALLLGAAKVLNEIRDEFPGAVKLLFQPAEEGPGGAEPMIKDGCLKSPDVDGIIAIHVGSGERTGTVGLRSGETHAAQDAFKIIIKGKGGHAASPHKTVDAIVLAAQAVQALQTIVSRKVDPLTPAVMTIGTIKGGYRVNIIADTVEMVGTYRFLDPDLKMQLRKWTEEILEGITRPNGGDYEIEYYDGYPVDSNDPDFYNKVKPWLVELLGKEKVFDVKKPTMGAEDFAYFTREKPSLFIRLGTGGEKEDDERFSNPHHHPKFDVDEKAFVNGASTFIKIALEFLNEK